MEKVAAGEKILDWTSYHVRDHLIVRDGRDRAIRDAPAIPEHREIIGNLAHLLEKMADIDHGSALVSQLANQTKQPLNIVALQAAGRLVHQDDA